MDSDIKKQIVEHYERGLSIRRITELIGNQCGRETIRKELKNANVSMRGKSTAYKASALFNSKEAADFSELLGYFYGDGHVSKNRNTSHGLYDCCLSFTLNETDIVNRVDLITENLFGFRPRSIKKRGYWSLRFRRSFAKYLASFGYPVGKKSTRNPRLPLAFLNNAELKIHFLRGFFNAEASINNTVFVHQSVQVLLPEDSVRELRRVGAHKFLGKNCCCFVPWSRARAVIKQNVKSRILEGVQQLLADLGIPSKLYPIRVYVGNEGIVGIHFELRISTKSIKRVSMLNLITSNKKSRIIDSLARR